MASAQHRGWWLRQPVRLFRAQSPRQGADLQLSRSLQGSGEPASSPCGRCRAAPHQEESRCGGSQAPAPLAAPQGLPCCPWGPLAGEAVLVCSAGFQGLPWTGPHPGCHISCPGLHGLRQRDSGWGSAGALGTGPVEVTPRAPPLPETAGGRFDPEKPGRAFQEWPVPAPPLLLPEACVERGACSRQRSLPSTLRPALEPPKECVCACVCAQDCKGQFPSGVRPHASR